MIYLIGGTPRCGKSTVAKQLGKKLNIPYMASDYLASAIQSKMSDQEELQLFGEKYFDDNNRSNNDVRFSVFSEQEQIGHYKTRAKRNREGIQNIIIYALTDKQDLIIEGFHLRPSVIIDKLQERKEEASYVLLYKSDVTEIEQGIKSNKHPNDRATKKTFEETTYPKIASFIHKFGTTMQQEAQGHNLQHYDMSKGGNFFKNIEQVVNDLEKKMKNK